MTEFDKYLYRKPTKKDRLNYIVGLLNEGEALLVDAQSKYKEFVAYREHLGYSWLERPNYKKEYDNLINWCHDWINKIYNESQSIGCEYLVQSPNVPNNIDQLDKIKCYTKVVENTVARLRPILDELQKQELFPQERIPQKNITLQPRFKNNYLYIGEHKIRLQKGTLNWCILKAVFDNRTSEDGVNATDIFELENPSEAQSREAHEKEKHKYLAARKRINDRITKETGINDDFILVNKANYSINKDFGL